MNIAIVGTGYVGLVTGVCFAEFGVNVTCVDKDLERIEKLTKGESPIHEPRLAEMLVLRDVATFMAFQDSSSCCLRSASRSPPAVLLQATEVIK